MGTAKGDKEGATQTIDQAGRMVQCRTDVLETLGIASCLSCRSQGVLGQAMGHVHLPAHQKVYWCVLGVGWGNVPQQHPSSSSLPPLGYATVALAHRVQGFFIHFLGHFPVQIRLTQTA